MPLLYSNNVQLTDERTYHSFLLDKNDYLQSLIYPFIRPNFVPKNGTVQLMICTTPSVHEANAKVISIKKTLKCTQMYHLGTLYCSFVSLMQYQPFDWHRIDNEITYSYKNYDFFSN